MKKKLIKQIKEKPDKVILISIFILILISVIYINFITLFEKSLSNNLSYYGLKQLIFAMLGFVLMFIVSKIPYHHLKAVAIWLILLSIFSLILVFFIGEKRNHATRWLNIGFGFAFQPLELVKLSIIVFFAYILDKKESYITDFKRTLIPHILLLCIFAFFFVKQPDFDSIAIIFLFSYIMMFVAKVPLKQLFISSVVTCVPSGFIIYFFQSDKISHIIERLRSFIDPMRYINDSSYQFLRSKYSLCESGFLGRGTENFRSLRTPELHTDFIITMILEDKGFIMSIIILALYFIIIYAGVYTALKSKDYFAKYLAFGIVLMLAIEVYINIGMVTGCAPTMGLTLPFLSYGGSSLLMHMATMGILLNIITYNKDI